LALLLGVALLTACAHTHNGSAGDAFDRDVLRKSTLMLIAWVAEGKPMPGYDLAFCPEQDRARLKECRILCAYLPSGTALSANPAVRRVYEKYGGPPFSESGVLAVELELRKRLDDRVILGLKVLNLSQAAYKTFTFENVEGKIRVK
jgi:hypothetical protein